MHGQIPLHSSRAGHLGRPGPRRLRRPQSQRRRRRRLRLRAARARATARPSSCACPPPRSPRPSRAPTSSPCARSPPASAAGCRSTCPSYLGQAPVGRTRAIVYDFLPGRHIAVDDVPPGDGLAGSIGHAIAAIHSLPTAFVADAGLPVLSAAECLTADHLADRVRRRHRRCCRRRCATAGATPRPTTRSGSSSRPSINGSLTAESFLVEDDAVTGVLGWSALRVGDPARDLHWLLAHEPGGDRTARSARTPPTRQVATDRQFTQRAMLYAELEVARWLLHGREMRDQTIVDDAVEMLDGLVDRVHSNADEPAVDRDRPDHGRRRRRGDARPHAGRPRRTATAARGGHEAAWPTTRATSAPPPSRAARAARRGRRRRSRRRRRCAPGRCRRSCAYARR